MAFEEDSPEENFSGDDVTVKLPAAVFRQTVEILVSGDEEERVEAAREIRRLTKTSARNRCLFYEAGAVEPLVDMLGSEIDGWKEAALLALLNLAVRDERNKIKIVDAGALQPIISILQSSDTSSILTEHATAALLTLSASTTTKLTISAHGAIPPLIQVLKHGTPQAKADSIMALYNLSTYLDNLPKILSSKPISPLLALLKTIKKTSKPAERCTALLESLSKFEDARLVIMEEEGGLLTIVEVIEEGSLVNKEKAVGVLLSICESDISKAREAILHEGAIPGLLEMTVRGTSQSQKKAKMLLGMLRDSMNDDGWEREEDHVNDQIGSETTRKEEREKARKILAEMVQVSMEQSLKHLQVRALLGSNGDHLPLAN